jgi:L-alanine-DL-glutamate epimerase-like enolase superfamily enzyme
VTSAESRIRPPACVRIRSVEAIPVQTTFKETFRYGTTERKDCANVIVRVMSEDGLVGYGEATPQAAFTAETQASIVDAVQRVASPSLVAGDCVDHVALISGLARQLPTSPFTLTAVDVALWDLLGKATGVQVAGLLGGRFRDRVPVHGSVGWGPAEDMVRVAEQQVGAGFTTLKLYAGRGLLREDLERLRAVRAAVPDEVDFLLDINGQWTANDCEQVFPTLKEIGVSLIEQPIAATDPGAQARVTAIAPMVVAADESVYSPEDVYAVAREQRAHAVNLGLSKLGGLLRAHQCAIVAAASKTTVLIGSVLELGIATAAGLHFAASVETLPFPSYLIGPIKYRQDIAYPGLKVERGSVRVPQGPGLGIEVDEELLASLDLRNA